MKCPKCQTENKEGVKFCIECGHKFELKCPRCGHSLPAAAKFCEECGHQLSLPSKPTPKDLSFDEKIRKIQKYLPGGLTEKILAQRDRIEGERKQVTVMFCDMEGFSPLVEKLGPEEAYALLDQVLEILIHKVHDYEGTVNKMTGDGVMALFGAPIALEDGPQRAIRSAHAIHREMVRFSDKLKQEKGLLPIKMRIGINTGPVVIGTLGNDLRVEFTAVGDTVNLASRMEGLAEPGATYVTEDTFRLTEGLFRFEALGEKQVKGRETPLKVYRVIAPSTRRTRFDVSAERGLTPFAGRERELELLLDGFERAKEGRGQAFSIMGEAGVGKSRLLYEFRKAITNEDVIFLEGKCLSYGRGMGYHPIIDILKSNFDIQEGDEDIEVREKVKRGLGVLKVDEVSTLPYLLGLLSVKDSGIDRISMSPEGKKDRIFESLKQIVLKGSGIRPLVVAIEDLHWIDKSSEDALKYFLESIPGARVLLIFTYRPEFVHTWGGRSYHNQITLNRLSNRESLFMVAHLLGTKEIDKDLERLILEKTEGVPFFIEELLKSLKDLKIIEKKDSKYQLARDVQAIAIPSTIQDMTMARVDSLPNATRTVLQTGSVIEREFPYDLIKRVTGLSEQQLLTHLSALKDSELLYEKGIYPQTSYIFRHALTREVVYDSILAKKKRELHAEIAKGIEELYKDSLADHYGALVEHFFTSENYAKAAEYSRIAGRKAQKAGSFKEAIEHARRRVICLERLPLTDEKQAKIIDARVLLADYLLNVNRFFEAKEVVVPIFDWAVQKNDQRCLPGIFVPLGAYYAFIEEEYSKGVEYLNEAKKVSEKAGDFLHLYFINFALGVIHSWYGGDFEKSIDHFEKAIFLSEMGKNLAGVSLMKGLMSAITHIYQGKVNLAYQVSQEAVLTAIEIGDALFLGRILAMHGVCCYFKGMFAEAEKFLLQGVNFCERTGNFDEKARAENWLALRYYDLGEYAKAQEYLQRCISTFELEGNTPSWANFQKLCVERIRIFRDDRDINLAELGTKFWKKNKLKVMEGHIARFIGEIFLNVDGCHFSDAESWITKAIEADGRNGTLWSLAGDFALYAGLFRRKGDAAKAKESLGKAIELFKKCGADGWVEKYEKELASIS